MRSRQPPARVSRPRMIKAGCRSMRRSIVWTLPVLAAVGAASVGSSARAQADSAEPAATAFERCRSDDFAAERRCYEIALNARLREGGAGAALALLDRLAALDEDVRREGHMYAHGIGIAALPSPDEVGRVFASCTPDFQSGCYHGVIQSYFLAVQRGGGEVTTATVDALCGDYRGPPANSFLLFQCTHGLGHGLTILNRHDLPRALAACDLISREWERESCYGGAFMENVVNETHPHHLIAEGTGSAPAGHGEGHGHDDHGDTATASTWRALDANDLHYPCSRMDAKYLNACYTIQTAAMLHFTGQDHGRAAAECARAPERVRETCFVSLGRDLSGIAAADPGAAMRLCGLAEPAFQPTCNSGVVQSLVNLNTSSEIGLSYCRLVPADSKRACYRAVGDQAAVLPDGAERRRAACRAVEPGYVEACLGEPMLEPVPLP